MTINNLYFRVYLTRWAGTIVTYASFPLVYPDNLCKYTELPYLDTGNKNVQIPLPCIKNNVWQNLEKSARKVILISATELALDALAEGRLLEDNSRLEKIILSGIKRGYEVYEITQLIEAGLTAEEYDRANG